MITTRIRTSLLKPRHPFRMSPRIDQSAIRARIRRLIAEKAGGKQQDFAALIDIQPSILSKALSGAKALSLGQLMAIERATDARLAWLLLGIEPMYYPEGKKPVRDERDHYEGTMLRRYLEINNINHTALATRIGKGKNTVQGYMNTETLNADNTQRLLSALEVPYETVFDLTPLLGVHSIDQPPAATPNRLRPVQAGGLDLIPILRIPVSARAGFGYQTYFAEQSPEREYVPVSDDRLYPGIPAERHAIIEINGDSMEPVLEHGYEVLAYRMPEGHLPSLNKIIVVDFRDELTIKRLVGVDYVADTITLRSENGGAELRLPMAEIRSVWHVYDYYKARL